MYYKNKRRVNQKRSEDDKKMENGIEGRKTNKNTLARALALSDSE